MSKTITSVKNQIIQATIDLIQQSNGNVNTITTRNISQKANVGIGLINYHFQTKENLIKISVQNIITHTITNFTPKESKKLSGIELLISRSKEVFDFLFAQVAVSKISIFDDYNNPTPSSNSEKSMLVFEKCLEGCNISNTQKRLFVFTLTSAMQTAFLQSEISKELLGYDFKSKHERDIFIENLNLMLFEGSENQGELVSE